MANRSVVSRGQTKTTKATRFVTLLLSRPLLRSEHVSLQRRANAFAFRADPRWVDAPQHKVLGGVGPSTGATSSARRKEKFRRCTYTVLVRVQGRCRGRGRGSVRGPGLVRRWHPIELWCWRCRAAARGLGCVGAVVGRRGFGRGWLRWWHGYIHLSTAAQLDETLRKHFPGQDDLVIAAIDLTALGGTLRWEVSRGGQLFPHVHGKLRLAHMLAHAPLAWENGSAKLPG